jgi:hypothetical protein
MFSMRTGMMKVYAAKFGEGALMLTSPVRIRMGSMCQSLRPIRTSAGVVIVAPDGNVAAVR